MNKDIIKCNDGADFEVDLTVPTETINEINNIEDLPMLMDVVKDLTDVNGGTVRFDALTNPVLSYDGSKWIPTEMWNPVEVGMTYPATGSVASANITESDEVQQLEKLEKLVEVACSRGHCDYDEYLYGMANGLILALAAMKDEEPQYLDRPEEWLCNKARPLGAAAEYGTRPESCTETSLPTSTRDEMKQLHLWDDDLKAHIDLMATELAKTVDSDIVEEIIKEAKKATNDDYERAMKGL